MIHVGKTLFNIVLMGYWYFMGHRMLWNLVESSEMVLICIVFYGKLSEWYDT